MTFNESNTLVTLQRAVAASKVREALLHRLGQLGTQFGDIRYRFLNALLVELQRLRHIIKDAQIIHDQAMRLFVVVWTIGTADGL